MGCSLHELKILAEGSNAPIATVAKDASYPAGFVIVVDLNRRYMTTDRAHAILGLDKVSNVGSSDAISVPQLVMSAATVQS
ncbi:MAG: hypothetical protein WD627_01230 [Actinomycetota bacterium]